MHETTTKQPLALDWAHIAFIVALIVIFLVVTCFAFRLKKYCTCVRPPAAPHLGYNGPAVGDADDGYIDPATLKSLRDNHGVCGTSQAGHGPIKGGPFSKQPMPTPRSQITSEDDHKIHYENINPAPRQSKQSLYHIEMSKDKAPKPSTPMQHRGSNSQSPVKGNLAGGYTQAVSTKSTVQISVEDGVEYYSDFDYGKTPEEGKPKLPSRRPIPSAPLGSDTS